MSKKIMWSYWNHEPIYHLKRMGNDGGTVFSLGENVDKWYERIHTEELIKKGAEIGINTVYTHYYKGSGILFEKEEMLRTKEFTKTAHKYGINVLGYMSMGSIYTENITREVPYVKELLVINRHGRFKPTLTDQYYRPRPCYNNDRYLEYLKSIIKYGIEEIGLDGFHFDNSSFAYCYCDHCQRKFKEYLKENFKNPYEVMGIKDFDYVEIPYPDYPNPLEDTHEIAPRHNVYDPLLKWYIMFLKHSVAKFHKECFDYVKEVSKGKAVVLHNPGFPRGYRNSVIGGFDPTLSPDSCDYIFVENSGGYFGKNQGRVQGQTLAFKYGERFNYKVFDTSWCKENGKLRFPKNKEEILSFVMQSAVYGDIVGVPWTIRSMKNGDEVAIDTPYLFNGLKDSFDYYKNNSQIFNAKSYNKVKVLHLVENLACSLKGYDELFSVTTSLITNNIPYSIITEDEVNSLKDGDTIVLPDILYCKNKLYEDLKQASLRGVNIVATGCFGRHNENTKTRSEKNEIYNLQGIEKAVLTNREEFLQYIPRTLTIDTCDVLLETRIFDDGKLALHVLNADIDRQLDQTIVTFKDNLLNNLTSYKVYTPDNSTCQVEIKNGVATIKIKGLNTLVSVVFEK